MLCKEKRNEKNDKKGDAKVEQNKVTELLAIVAYSKDNLS